MLDLKIDFLPKTGTLQKFKIFKTIKVNFSLVDLISTSTSLGVTK